MVNRPFVTVGGLIFAPDGDIFLVRSKKWKDLYSLPGGKVEWGETRLEAFKREVFEETGLKICKIKFEMVQESIFSEEFWDKGHFVMNDFVAELDPSFSKDKVLLNDEAYEYLWIKPAQALKLPLHKACRLLIERYLTQQKPFNRWGFIGFKNHKVFCKIGIYPQEKAQEQTLYFDVKAKIDFNKCSTSDCIKDTLDYTKLAHVCTMIAKRDSYQLLETLSCAILDYLFSQFDVQWVHLRIKKPGAISSANFALVEIEQERSC
ncbi:dihydroneopterin aldolase [Candidatus Protochlamydia sp. W-9]|uniref:dihydroneopterin aldolase n=1 Tax=Candidatus Protochlamydia sp. W-9 TaxID=1785087 RepID=UPI00096ABC32|nr:dihydroneopterin aldolase [Candidatus Protochlamydia sp. W-9]